MRKIAIAFALLLGLCAPALAQENCPPLKEIVSVNLEWDAPQSMWLVPVTIQGVPKKLLLDTGGITSQLSESTVDELKLHKMPSDLTLLDASGNKNDKKVKVDEIIMGGIRATDVEFQVSPDNFGTGIAGSFIGSPNFDLDLDFGAGKMNYFSPDHCPGRIQYWEAPAIAAVPIQMRNGHVQLNVSLNGKLLTAILDTGANHSLLNADIASRVFGLTPDSPGMVTAGNVNGDAAMPAHFYTFDSVNFDGVAVTHPRMTIFSDQARKGADQRLEIGSSVKRHSDEIDIEPATLGMDILKHLHIYISYKEKIAYITAAASPAPGH